MSKSQLIRNSYRTFQNMSMMLSVNISIQKSGSRLVKCFPDLPPTFPDSGGYHYGCDFCKFRLSAMGKKQKNPQLPGIFQTHEHEASMKTLLSLLAITLNLGIHNADWLQVAKTVINQLTSWLPLILCMFTLW